jgi:hypothetical protein
MAGAGGTGLGAEYSWKESAPVHSASFSRDRCREVVKIATQRPVYWTIAVLDLNDFFYFVQVVDRGGVTAAGRTPRIPKSTLSHRIQPSVHHSNQIPTRLQQADWIRCNRHNC